MRKLTLAALLCSACTFHSTDSTEQGVLTRKVALFGKSGIQPEPYAPGTTYTFPAFITDWHVYNVALQNLEMVQSADKGDRAGRDDIEFKTHDGNDITVDVTVSWRIDPAKTPWILEHVGGSTAEVKENLVRPACRSIVRDVLNTMTSEEFYVSDRRFQKAEEARAELTKLMGPEGVIVERVIMGEHHFHPDYEKVIHDKKLAEQTAERMVSEGHAAQQEFLRNLETAKGQVSQKIATAQGQLDQVKLAADADLFRSQREAEAILSERRAHAKGVEKQNQAMSGAGGRTLVKLRIAEALAGKQIVFLPGGGKAGSLQTTNLNDLLTRFAVVSSVEKEAAEPSK
ncbi:MAG TPA: SPFH domain-containing protein [Myxococcales bacterium]|jgi:regulator of protease activity HflC (stomatin/prohibitin superfamily)|nr:SPFH domain-containing protein [Myxococcales bacterium]